MEIYVYTCMYLFEVVKEKQSSSHMCTSSSSSYLLTFAKTATKQTKLSKTKDVYICVYTYMNVCIHTCAIMMAHLDLKSSKIRVNALPAKLLYHFYIHHM